MGCGGRASGSAAGAALWAGGGRALRAAASPRQRINPRPEQQRALSAWLEERKGPGKRAYPTLPGTNDKTKKRGNTEGRARKCRERKQDAKSRCHAASLSDPAPPSALPNLNLAWASLRRVGRGTRPHETRSGQRYQFMAIHVFFRPGSVNGTRNYFLLRLMPTNQRARKQIHYLIILPIWG
ncbi:hypothetical protein C8F04DRAFT_1177660 [Mycena alexandri]|uniref:Uncharacterized protein n=1 Tax=Mycena alexandri TaxID=1745969 RepID=A0AAD6T7U7_9AGAR|nr:hypothetical protein C8F04DRAFT_1177660 [Mycena alexandri]